MSKEKKDLRLARVRKGKFSMEMHWNSEITLDEIKYKSGFYTSMHYNIE